MSADNLAAGETDKYGYEMTNDVLVFAKRWKKNKGNFRRFVVEYNEKKIQLEPEEKEALEKLHTFWKSANMSTGVDEFFKCKDLHAVLNRTLNGNKTWEQYIMYFMQWRVDAMRFSHQSFMQQGGSME